MTLLERLRAKQKADKEKRELFLTKRRGYARAAKERALAAASGIQDLPVEVQVAVQDNLKEAPAESTPPPAPKPMLPDATVAELIARLSDIKERLFRLHSVYAVTLSHDVFREADRYRELFRELGEQLSAKDPDAFDALILGHEALLLAEPLPSKPTLPLGVQQYFEMSEHVSYKPAPVSRPVGYVADGLQSLL